MYRLVLNLLVYSTINCSDAVYLVICLLVNFTNNTAKMCKVISIQITELTLFA